MHKRSWRGITEIWKGFFKRVSETNRKQRIRAWEATCWGIESKWIDVAKHFYRRGMFLKINSNVLKINRKEYRKIK